MGIPTVDERVQEQVLRHNDCRDFCSVDVAKGICRLTQEVVLIDSVVCSEYVQLPKCKFCAYFSTGDQEGIGTCNAEASHPWAYPEMIAVTCEMFR
jgi:4-hydroxyphenylacetate decarboxylase small subunit